MKAGVLLRSDRILSRICVIRYKKKYLIDIGRVVASNGRSITKGLGDNRAHKVHLVLLDGLEDQADDGAECSVKVLGPRSRSSRPRCLEWQLRRSTRGWPQRRISWLLRCGHRAPI
jgi:hypothetical protein